MKIFLFFLFLLPFYSYSNGGSEFVVESKNGYWCIPHIAQKQESLLELANDYSVRISVLASINNLSAKSILKINQAVSIPLIETNYFRMNGMSAGNGFYPLYYLTSTNDDAASICKKFSLQEFAFIKWNGLNGADRVKENEKVIIGWIKYLHKNEVNTILSSKVKSPILKQTNSVTTAKLSNETIAQKEISYSKKQIAPISSEKFIDKEMIEVKQNVVKPSYIYKENERKKTGNKFSSFFKNVKTKITPAKKIAAKVDEVEIAKPIVKRNFETKNEIVKSKPSSTVQAETEINTKKKSFKEIWSNIVNGKEPRSTIKHNQSVVAVKPKPVEKSIVSVTKKVETKVTNTKQPIVNNKAIAQKKIEPKNIKAPAKVESKKLLPENVMSSKPVVLSSEKKNNTNALIEKQVVESPKKEIAKVVSVVSPLNKSAEIKKVESYTQPELAIHSQVKSNAEAVLPMIEGKPKGEASNLAIVNEIKKLSLAKSKTGKCAYFFSGPGAGQFYIFTNLVEKGQIVKIINTQNGRYIMAEVIGALPNADVSKGLLIKLSDNAKLPLAQKNSSFTVKVNY